MAELVDDANKYEELEKSGGKDDQKVEQTVKKLMVYKRKMRDFLKQDTPPEATKDMDELVEEASKKAMEERGKNQNSITELRNQVEWSKSLVTGDPKIDPEIDTQKVEPKNIKLSYQDPKTQMVYKRRRKDFLKQDTPPVIPPFTKMRRRTCDRDSGDCAITTESHTLQYDSKHKPKSSDITPQKDNSNGSLYLNKKTRKRPKQGKYVPTVLEDCKPRRTPKLKTPRLVTPKRVKREKNYAGRKSLSVIEDYSLICANSCRRVLKFEMNNELRDGTTAFTRTRSVLNFPKEFKKKRIPRRRKQNIFWWANGNNVNRHFYSTRRRSRLENAEMPMKVRHEFHQEKGEKSNDISRESNQEQNQDESSAGDERMREEKEEYWEKERKVFGERVKTFITVMRTMQGNRQFSPWKGSVLDSVVGVFLTQNVSDHLSSSAYMELAAKFPLHSTRDHNSCCENCIMGIQNTESIENREGKKRKSIRSHVKKIQISGAAGRQKSKMFGKTKTDTSKKKDGKGDTFDWDSLRKIYWSEKPTSSDHKDSVDWEAVRNAKVSEVTSTIQARGQHNVIAERIQEFLNRVVRLHGSLDLEWLRDVPPEETKKYLLGINGLGLKSVECLRLLTLQHAAFPVDINVARIVVRLGWVPLKPLPEGVQIHLLKKYPLINPIQKYLWPRLCHLDQETLYELHYHMITFGKVFCTKKNPNCNACPMRGGCKHFASAFASAKLALPGPSNESTTTASSRMISAVTIQNRDDAYQSRESEYPTKIFEQHIIEFLESSEHGEYENKSFEQPIIEFPESPERDTEDMISEPKRNIDDKKCDDSDEIHTIKLNDEQKNLIANLEAGDFSKALVALSCEAAAKPMPKLKLIGRLRTEHLVYELPDGHPILEGLDTREPDDPCSYLLAVRTSDKTVDEERCNYSHEFQEQNLSTVRGTILIPCRTAMRGRFSLNGTFFQINEVFADDESSHRPVDVPRELLWNLPRRIVYFGTSPLSIFKGLSAELIARCFRQGYICVRGFDRKSRAPTPLLNSLHRSTPSAKKKETSED